jgi:hypothetical protein
MNTDEASFFAIGRPRVDINRNQFFMIGLLLLFLGLQLRLVESYVLNAKASEFLAKRLPKQQQTNPYDRMQLYMAAQGPAPLRKIVPPKAVGYLLLSVGAVLTLHALSMKKPGAG